ncbi:MAG: carbon-nitrogen hydrolase family protein [Desulfurococcaceae archaeon]
MSRLIVGIVQASYTTQPLENIDKTYSLIKKNYREADLIILPEYSMTNPLIIKDPGKVYEISEYPTSSKYLPGIARIANEYGVNILVHFIEKTDKPPLTKSTSILVTSRGEILPVYNKIHLFDAYGFRESTYFEPGKSLSKLISVNGFQLAFAICYDIRFPELFRSYALLGAHAVIIQSGWVRGPLKEEILDKLASSRAHENTMYIILANQTGEMFTGRSGVFNPWGYRELDLGIDEKYSEHTLTLSEVEKAREVLPLIKQSADRWDIKFKPR